MENSKKTFIAGINADDSFFAHTGQDNLDALNVRVVSSSEGKAGSISNVNGTRYIPNARDLSSKSKCIGTYEDPTTNNVFYFIVDENSTTRYKASSIYCYKPKEDNIYKVLADSNMETSYRLGFDPEKPITGIAYIDDILYWTGIDGKEPFRINVERGIAANNSLYDADPYDLPIKKSIVTLIRKPPMLPLKITVQEDDTRDTSFLKSRAHTFAYRYVYKDGETSVFSPTSYHYPNQDMDDENHATSKKIKVDFPQFEADETGISQDVHKVQYAVKFDSDTSYFIWKEFDSKTHETEFTNQTKSQSGVITADFYNDVLGFAVDDVNSIKLSDAVPYEAEALSIARNRLFLGNIKEGRLNPEQITSEDISLDLLTQSFTDSFNQYDRDRGGKVGFAHSSAYQIGIAFFDFAGRTGGVLTDDSLKVITPERGVTLSTYNSSIRFNLNQSLASKIPDWAEYYAIVRTKNLTKDFTISNLSDKVRYYKTASTGNFTVNVEKTYPINDENDRKAISDTPNGTFSDAEHVSFRPDFEGCAIGLGDLTSYKQGYTYQEGDRVKLITNDGVIEAAVTGQSGRYVTTNLYDLNDEQYLNTSALSNKDYAVVYEIYSPHKIQPNEFYYEAFNGRILRDSSGNASFSNTTGELIGDVYLRKLIADTSTLESYFFEGKSSTEGGQDHELRVEIKYIDYPIFYGEGENDLECNTGANNGSHNLDLRYDIKISSTGTPDKFRWRKRTRTQYTTNVGYSGEVSITGNTQTLDNGVTIKFESTTGHTVDDRWVVNAKIADNSGMNEEHKRYTATWASPPNGTILINSEIRLYLTEYKGGTLLASEDRRTWEVTYPASSVTRTYDNIEELFWESSFGSVVMAAAQGDMDNFSFRRGVVDPSGNGGQTQLNILNYQGSAQAQEVSKNDGSTIHMIYEGVLRKRGGGRNIDGNHTINIDYTDEFPYAAESMNPSNDYFLNWTQITGKPNLVPSEVSSQKKTTAIVFSETKIPGSKINGLSKFSALDEKRLDDATGPLRALKITSKTQSTGSVMLAISENETTGIYLGEQQLQQTSSGGQFLAVSSGVIGTMNTLKGSYGTMHPESIVVNEGTAFWFDVKNETVIRYDSNGLTAIGDNKMKTFFKEKSNIILSDRIKNFVIGTYDDYNSEYIISLPSTGEVVTVLQEDPYYPDTPIIDITNIGEEPTDKIVNYTILGPWNITGTVTVTSGVGQITFDSPFSFSIPSDAIEEPENTNITIINSTSGGFNSPNNDGQYISGSGSLTVSNVGGDVEQITIKLTRIKELSGGKVVVLNPKLYFNDTSFDFGETVNGNTPIRINGAVDSTIQNFEEKEITVSSGSIVIPITTGRFWQFGNDDENSINFSECSQGACTIIPTNRISTTATPITEGSETIGYLSGNSNINISGIDEDIDSITIESRPLKRAVISLPVFTNVATTSLTFRSGIVLNRETPVDFGFVISETNSNPAIGDSDVTLIVVGTSASDAVDFNTTASDLSPSTTYYVKPFLRSNFGTSYGSCVPKTTGQANVKPSQIETKPYDADINRFEGTVYQNQATVSEYGFVWSTTETDPQIGYIDVEKILVSGEMTEDPQNYQSNVLRLVEDTTHYFRAYVIDSVGTHYGLVKTMQRQSGNLGISGFRLRTAEVHGNGGPVQIDVFKSLPEGSVSGTIQVDLYTNDQILVPRYSSVGFENNQSVDSITISVHANYGNPRDIYFKVSSFDGISNETGIARPVSITGSVSQGSSTYQP